MRRLFTGVLLLVAAHPLGAQQESTSRQAGLRIGLGVVSPSTWLEGPNGLSVSAGMAPAITAEVRFPRRVDLEYLLGIRASRAGITVESAGSYEADPIYIVDAFAGAARVVDGRLAFRGGLVGALVAGGDVAPFTEASRLAPGVEIGAALRITDRVPLWLALDAQALRYGGGGSAPTGAEAGAVYRVIVGVRHGR